MNNSSIIRTPVLFLIFNRFDTTKKVFAEIKRARPALLFIASDGPREGKDKEREVVEKIREYVLNNIDWKCRVKTLFRKKNLGCKYAVSGAISWFFKNVDRGIILEDDCLPSQDFFLFCQELLEKYKDDERIMQISGTNVETESKIIESYFFSRYFNAWGWATWKRAWNLYDLEMKYYEEIANKGGWNRVDNPPFNGFEGRRLYNLLKSGKLNTWDYQWIYSCIINSGLCIVPKVNLISNLGFEGEATHTNNYGQNKKLERHELDFPIIHNPIVMSSRAYSTAYFKFFQKGRIGRKILSFFKK
jgi:hypothetical protein